MRDTALGLRNKKIMSMEGDLADLTEEYALAQFNLEETEIEVKQKDDVISAMKGTIPPVPPPYRPLSHAGYNPWPWRVKTLRHP